MVAGALFVAGNVLGGIVCTSLAILVRWLHQIAIDRGET
jgi:hypothetical protein